MATTTNKYTGDGSTVLYSFSFPYLEISDIKVQVGGDKTTEYLFANATTIQLNTPPADGESILIYRETGDDDLKAVFFPGSSIKATDLNDNFSQTLYVVQEIESKYINRDGTLAMNADLDMGGYSIVDAKDITLSGLTATKDLSVSDSAKFTDVDASGVVTGTLDGVIGSVTRRPAYFTTATATNFIGDLSGNVFGTFTGTVTGDIVATTLSGPAVITEDVSASDTAVYSAKRANTRFLATEDWAEDVQAVADNIGSVEAVGSDLARKFIHVSDYGGVNDPVVSVPGETSNVITVAESIDDINALADRTDKIDVIYDDIKPGGTGHIQVIYNDIKPGGPDNVGTVADDIINVNTVAVNIDAVMDVATNIGGGGGSIDINSDNIDNINIVAGSIDRVNAVVNISTEIQTVVDFTEEVVTVVAIEEEIVAVVNNESDISTVADDLLGDDCINTVGRDLGEKNGLFGYRELGIGPDYGALTAAGSTDNYGSITDSISTELNYNDDSIILIVSDNLTEIKDLTPYVAEIALLGTPEVVADMASLSTPAVLSDLHIVGGIASDLTSVAEHLGEIINVSSNEANISTVVANISDINDAADNAASALSSASQATNSASQASASTSSASTAATTSATKASEASSSATAAASSATAASRSAYAAALSVEQAQEIEGIAAGYVTLLQSIPYDINTNSSFGNTITASGSFANEDANTKLSMTIGSNSYDYGTL